jgi:hypothetical protein
LGLAFLLFASIATAWSPVPIFGIEKIWQLWLIGFCFLLGSQLDEAALDRVFLGFAYGLCVSTFVGLIQFFGWAPVLTLNPGIPTGLFYSQTVFAEASVLVLLWALLRERWILVPPLLLNMVLAQSKGSWIALAIGLVAIIDNRRVWLATGAACAVGIVAAIFFLSGSAAPRLALWSLLLHNLFLFGHGPNALGSAIFVFNGTISVPEYAHNELLDFAYAYGIAAALPALLATGLALCVGVYRPVYLAFLTLTLYSFPLHAPLTAAIAALASGSLCSGWPVAWGNLNLRGLGLPYRYSSA